MKNSKKDNKDVSPPKGELKENIQADTTVDEVKKSAKKLFSSLKANKKADSRESTSATESD
jgi:hypothetical protein